MEFGQLKDLFSEHVQKQLSKEYDLLESQNGRIITTVTAIALVIIAFLESQINFYLLNKSQTAKKKLRIAERKNRILYGVNDQSADLEYVIPKKNDVHKKQSTDEQTVHVHTKSWVFEGTGEEEPFDDSSVSLCSTSSPSHSNAPQHNHSNQTAQTASSSKRRFSRISDATSERFAQQMTSFSRCATPSPVPRSGQITPTGHGTAGPSSFCDYIDSAGNKPNRLTVDFVTTSAIVPKVKSNNNCSSSSQPASLTTQADDSPYASLLAELEQSLHEKKSKTSSFTVADTTAAGTDKLCSPPKPSPKDFEFSQELEAALQLIQELETPSEGPFDHLPLHHLTAHMTRSDSEKTLSAACSLPSSEAGPPPCGGTTSGGTAVGTPQSTHNPHRLTIDIPSPHNGKHILNVLCNESNSQSTSGYSSPNSSNLNSMREFDSEHIELMHHQPYCTAGHQCGNGVVAPYIKTLDIHNLRQAIDSSSPIALTSSKSSPANKSFLLFKKRSKLMPQADFHNRIFKSECLAYLTEEELIERHHANRNVIRKIELNVARRVKGCQHYSNNSINN